VLLQRALESVATQTFSDYEVIVVDDGSTDETAEMIKAFFPNVRYFKQANKGVSSTRNKGFLEEKGEWLAFLDSDDEWLPQKLEKQMAKKRIGIPQLQAALKDLILNKKLRQVMGKKQKHTLRKIIIIKICLRPGIQFFVWKVEI